MKKATESKAGLTKDKTPSQKAMETAKWAKTMTKVVISQNNQTGPFWHVINFLGPGGSESGGIVDLLAIRKDHAELGAPLKKGDLFEIVLIQVKGGVAPRPTAADRQRLRQVAKAYAAKSILLSEWKKGASPTFYALSNDSWIEADVTTIFGRKTKAAKTATRKSKPITQSTTNAADKAWATRRAKDRDAKTTR